jgi:hypothetical protein
LKLNANKKPKLSDLFSRKEPERIVFECSYPLKIVVPSQLKGSSSKIFLLRTFANVLPNLHVEINDKIDRDSDGKIKTNIQPDGKPRPIIFENLTSSDEQYIKDLCQIYPLELKNPRKNTTNSRKRKKK